VDLDQRGAQLGTRVAQRHRRVRQTARVEHHRLPGVGGTVNPIQQVCFAIALPHNGLQPQLDRGFLDQRRQLVVGCAAVQVGLAQPEPAQVGPVDHVDHGRHAAATSA
jgi:hypothetical protein